MKEFVQKIFSIKNDNKCHKVFTIFGLKLKLLNQNKKYKLLKNSFSEQLVNLENKLTARIQKIMPFTQVNIIEIHIVDHCNFNCKGCTHFAPLADETYLTLEEFEADLKRLYEITNGEIKIFHILGGEPLLHPKCIEFLKSTRKIFPKSIVKLVTNGILLPEQADEFYKSCAEYDITIAPTKYQIGVKWIEIENKCEYFNVKLDYFMGSGQAKKVMHKIIFDIEGKQNPKEQFLKCWLDNPGLFYLDHGKLYKCAQVPFIRFFNHAFNLNLEVKKSDYINIYDNITLNHILEFMSKPSQFCRYCSKDKTIGNLEWQQSEKKITEWIENIPETLVAVEREREREKSPLAA